MGTGSEVNDRSLGKCGGTKQLKHKNISVIDGIGVKVYLVLTKEFRSTVKSQE